MANISKVPLLILYGSVIARLVVWPKANAWPSFTPEMLVAYPPQSSINALNVVFSFLWNLPIELWFIGPSVLLLILNAMNRDDPRSSPVLACVS